MLDLPNAPALKEKPWHSRSHSHPIVSLFNGLINSHRVDEAEGEGDILNGPFPANPLSAGKLLNASMASSAPNGSAQIGEKDLITGRCATCDSLVRWPKYLDVFRCTVCLMVNELKPVSARSGEAPPMENPSDAPTSSRPRTASKGSAVPFISLDRTLRFINECIDAHFQSCADRKASRGADERRPSSQNHASTSLSPHLAANGAATKPARSAADAESIIPSPSRPPPPPPGTPRQSNAGPCFDRRPSPPPSSMIFGPLENYIKACFKGIECMNASFLASKPPTIVRAASESVVVQRAILSDDDDVFDPDTPFPELDAKTLLLGDFAENGMWWAGKTDVESNRMQKFRSHTERQSDRVNAKSPRIQWAEVNEWYHSIIFAERHWRRRIDDLKSSNSTNEIGLGILSNVSAQDVENAEEEVLEGCAHLQRTLLKASENLLRRPGRPVTSPADCRFLLILLANPLLHSSEGSRLSLSPSMKTERSPSYGSTPTLKPAPDFLRKSSSLSSQRSPSTRGMSPRHSGVTKRILGIMSNLPIECHRHFVCWFSRYSESHLRRLVDLTGSFVSYRLTRQHVRERSNSHDPTAGGLIPSISGPGAGTSAQLHAALGVSTASRSPSKTNPGVAYSEDWQIRSAAKVMSLLFSANNNDVINRHSDTKPSTPDWGRNRANSSAQKRAHSHGQLLPTSVFYNTLLDYSDLIADFEIWESRRGKFSFCQYPMFLSIWAKIHIMEHDARRQMEIKAREAFFNSIMSRKAISQYLVLKVRRDCLIEDSLRGVSEVVGTGQEEIKKGLRIEFLGEEGMDAGGLRKEWFLLLVREVFEPEHGLFVYDEDSHYCYFNPNTFETSDQFFLVGVLLGLAIYNSTMLDVALPPFVFRRLLASAPNYTGPTTSSSRPAPGYGLEDLGEFRPALAHGLRQLLDYDGDVEQTFCRDFVATTDRYGQIVTVPLCPDGERRAVTKSNRREFVDLYIRHLLDTSVSRQYEPFKRGFFTVCGGNALSLFRPEEIELLIRGSDEPLDVATLKTVAIYDGWGKEGDAAKEPVVGWFWDAFARANSKDQRKLLGFITASDRIPAMGTTSLVIKIVCLGEDAERYPIARTCFNMLSLYRYRSREVLERRLWGAVRESEGFGMK